MGVTAITKEGLVRAPVSVLYDIVADVERYPEFLPEIKEVRRCGNRVRMSMELGSIKISWEQEVEFVPDQAIRIRLVRGPFRVFDVDWEFEPVTEGTLLKHQTRFEFALRLPGLGQIIKRSLEKHTETTIEAFRKRLEDLNQPERSPGLQFSGETTPGC